MGELIFWGFVALTCFLALPVEVFLCVKFARLGWLVAAQAFEQQFKNKVS